MNKNVFALATIAAVTAGCRSSDRPRTQGEEGSAPSELRFVIAEPTVSDAPVPARFSAPIPSDPDAIWGSEAPPPAWVRRRIALADALVQEQFLTAVQEARRNGVPAERLVNYDTYLGDEMSVQACAWIGTHRADSDAFVHAAEWCEDPDIARPAGSGDREFPPRASQNGEILELLDEQGLSYWFDTETDQFPNEHDALLASLAALAPALDGSVFEEQSPPEDIGRYQLRAYLRGRRFALDAENLGDWYDVGAVIGLLNAMLVAEKSAWRMLVLETGDQTTIVIAGPAAELEHVVDAGLVKPAPTSDAVEDGKAVERQVRDRLGAPEN